MTFFQKLFVAIMLIVLGSAQSPPPMQDWVFTSDGFREGKLSTSALTLPLLYEADLDGDGKDECLLLEDGHAKIVRSPCTNDTLSQPLWQSPDDWQVIQGMLTDLNRDGNIEATLLVWRPYQRWAIDKFLLHPGRLDNFQNSEGMSCHVILIGTKPNRPGLYRELWAGSAMAAPFTSFAAADVDNNGSQELIALEGDYKDNSNLARYDLTLWEWNGFGFTLLTRLKGSFRGMKLVSPPDGQIHIITHG
jgi:hypothetical protein